jgi:hypothetical protein
MRSFPASSVLTTRDPHFACVLAGGCALPSMAGPDPDCLGRHLRGGTSEGAKIRGKAVLAHLALPALRPELRYKLLELNTGRLQAGNRDRVIRQRFSTVIVRLLQHPLSPPKIPTEHRDAGASVRRLRGATFLFKVGAPQFLSLHEWLQSSPSPVTREHPTRDQMCV